MKNEIWKDIEGYEGLYQVSNFGRVKSLNYNHTGKEGLIKTFLSDSGRIRCTLNNNGYHHYFVHILVAKAFVYNDDPKNKIEVHHIDFNKTNNISENLIWMTKQQHKDIHRQKIAKPVDCFDLNGNFVKHYHSIKSVEKDGHASTYVMNICKHKIKHNKYHNLIWKFSETN